MPATFSAPPPRWQTPVRCWALAVLVWAALAAPQARAEEEAAAIERRLADSARYLASEELQGRGLGTKGLDLAADYIAAQFAQAGLKTDLFDGGPFQKFTATTAIEVGKDNRLTLVGPSAQEGQPPQRIDLVFGKDFTPLSLSGSKAFDLPLVFAGYGITAEREKYDDYAGVDVAGKAVVILRHEPQQEDPKSVFDGLKDSQYAWLSRKASNAFDHKAAAVVFCTDEVEIRRSFAEDRKKWHEALDRLTAEHETFKKVEKPTSDQVEAQRRRIEELLRQAENLTKKLREEHDPMLPFYAGGGSEARREFPVVHCRRAVLDRIIKAALNTDLAAVEKKIDETFTPQSRELLPWRVTGQVDVRSRKVDVKNVVGVLAGEGPTAEETIVVGAHYDHLGLGGRGSLSGKQAVHPGADDNASGVAAMLEIARALAARPEKPNRRVVFVGFTAEESGMIGSSYYVQHPLFPLEKTVAMINMDMIGRLRDERLTVVGSASGKPFGEILDQANRGHGLKVSKPPGGPGPSDQMPFYGKGVPVMHFFTGTHSDYHRTSDQLDTLNIAGMRRITQLAEDVVVALADAPARPEFVAIKPSRLMASAGKRPFFGTMPDFSGDGAGYVLADVLKDGPAERAGLRPGDAVIEFGPSKIGNLEDFTAALEKHKPGEKVKTVVRRGEQTLTVEVTLDPPR